MRVTIVQINGSRGWHVHLERERALPYAPHLMLTYCGKKIENAKRGNSLEVDDDDPAITLACPRCRKSLKGCR